MICFKDPKIIPKLNIVANDNPTNKLLEFNFSGITIDQKHCLEPTHSYILTKYNFHVSYIHPHLIYGLNLSQKNPMKILASSLHLTFKHLHLRD